MGVKKLWTLLQQLIPDDNLLIEDLSSNPKKWLLIDCNGFIYHLYDTLARSNTINRLYGGSYCEFAELVKVILKHLQQYFHLQFYLDGNRSYFKQETIEKRFLDTEESWDDMFRASLGDCNVDQTDLPLPPLSRQLLMKIVETWPTTMNGSKIEVIHCKSEADYDMGLACAQLNRVGEQAYCYTGDSDFLVMVDCAVIRFGGLDPTCDMRMVPVWRREQIADLLSLDEDQYVEWCLGLSNDYISKERLLKSLNLTEDPMEWLSEIRSRQYFMVSCPDDADSQAAIEYSRALYQLEDISRYCLEKYRAKISVSDDEGSAAYGIGIRDQERAQYYQWLEKHKHKIALGSIDVNSMLIEFLEQASTKDSESSFALFTPQHLAVLKLMVQSLKNKKRASPKAKPVVEWTNVLAANLYQIMLRYLSSFVKVPCVDLDPRLCYDGITFHTFMASVTPIPPTPSQPIASSSDKLNSVTAPSNSIIESSSAKTQNFISSTSKLPADEYRNDIVNKIRQNRVSVICGETGCGKSSRVPVFLMEDAERRGEWGCIFISQPRRIAVVNLYRRLKESMGDQVGMRLGYGVREGTNNSKIFFVTSGYLIQLLLHQPNAVQKMKYVIIDEVHERSIESDLLCWLMRELMIQYDHIHLVLMSATLDCTIYHRYFSGYGIQWGDMSSLHVGARRFPIEIVYVDTWFESLNGSNGKKKNKSSLAPSTHKAIKTIIKHCSHPDASLLPIHPDLVTAQYDLATLLVRTECAYGTGVLIFVPGLADITELHSRFEALSDKYNFVALHSELPFEDQLQALLPAAENEVKVVVATNAAESSITLPDIDLVICLGCHKSLRYSPEKDQRAMLTKCWISQSSATQRAGRTGRVRPGRVYRLYSKELFEKLPLFDNAEIHNQPLHNVVLQLSHRLEALPNYNGITSILTKFIEPPSIYNIQSSLEYLFQESLITRPDDDGRCTSLGAFASFIRLDLLYSKMVAMGISLGVGWQAVVLACALSQPRTIFRQATPFIHKDPDELNGIIRQVFMGMYHFDRDTYSHPIMMLNIFIEWWRMKEQGRGKHDAMMQSYGIVRPRLHNFVSSVKHIIMSLSTMISLPSEEIKRLDIYSQPDFVPDYPDEATLNKLRLILVWTLHENFMVSTANFHSSIVSKRNQDYIKGLNVVLSKPPFFEQEHLLQYFPKPFNNIHLRTINLRKYRLPGLTCRLNSPDDLMNILTSIDTRVLSQLRFLTFLSFLHVDNIADTSTKSISQGKKEKANKVAHDVSYLLGLVMMESEEADTIWKGLWSICSTDQVVRQTALDDHGASIIIFNLGLVSKSNTVLNSLSKLLWDKVSDNSSFCHIHSTTASGKLVNLTMLNQLPSMPLLVPIYTAFQCPLSIEQFQAMKPESENKTQVLDFSPLSDQQTAEEPVSRGNRIRKFSSFSDVKESSPIAPLFQDLPKEMRLFNAYSERNYNRKMRISVFDKEEEKVVVPGTIEYKKMKEQEAEGQEVIDKDGQSLCIAVSQCMWKVLSSAVKKSNDNADDGEKIGEFGDGNENWTEELSEMKEHGTTVIGAVSGWMDGLIQGPSYVVHSRNVTNDIGTLYAIAGRALITIKQQKPFISCHDVTFLPSKDNVWISRALLCIDKRIEVHGSDVIVGMSLKGKGDENKLEHSNEEDEKAPKKLDCCKAISNMLSQKIAERPISLWPNLINWVDLLFDDIK